MQSPPNWFVANMVDMANIVFSMLATATPAGSEHYDKMANMAKLLGGEIRVYNLSQICGRERRETRAKENFVRACHTYFCIREMLAMLTILAQRSMPQTFAVANIISGMASAQRGDLRSDFR